MMFIEQRPEGWTVVQRETGAVMLKDPGGGSPWFLATREEVVAQCRAAGLMQARAGNPGGWPEGTLLELAYGAPVLGAGDLLPDSDDGAASRSRLRPREI